MANPLGKRGQSILCGGCTRERPTHSDAIETEQTPTHPPSTLSILHSWMPKYLVETQKECFKAKRERQRNTMPIKIGQLPNFTIRLERLQLFERICHWIEINSKENFDVKKRFKKQKWNLNSKQLHRKSFFSVFFYIDNNVFFVFIGIPLEVMV